jgi:addiction module RelB/DinJ family antitoxin
MAMGATVVVHATVDAALRDQATAALAEIGLTVDEALQLLLKHVVRQHDLPFLYPAKKSTMPGAPPDAEIGEGKRFPTYDDWFRAEVEEAIREADDPNCVWVTNEEVERQSAERRAEWQAQIERRRKSA